MQIPSKLVVALFAANIATLPLQADEGGASPRLESNPIPIYILNEAGSEEETELDDLIDGPSFLHDEANITDTETADVAITIEERPAKNPLPGNALPGNALPGNPLPGNGLPGNVLPGNTLPDNALPIEDEPEVDTAAGLTEEPYNEESFRSNRDEIEPSRELLDRVDPNAPLETVEERYDSGKVKIRREMTLDVEGNYVRHGGWTMFSETGQTLAEGKFVANQRHGAWYRTVEWGQSPLLNTQPYPSFEAPFRSEAQFASGKLHGKWTITDKQGRLASEWLYQNGQLEGKARWFHPDGSIREEVNYVNGLIDGEWRIVEPDGKVESSTFVQGRKLASKQDVYEDGSLKWDGVFLHETFVVNTEDDWWNTKPVTYKKVGDPERHGKFTSWYENGHKKFTGEFKHEVRTGEFTWWHENTQVAVKGAFVDGERDGVWTWWHENGQKAIQGRYQTGKLDGPWSYWNADGKLERKIDYSGKGNSVTVHSVPHTQIASPLRPVRPVPAANGPVGTGLRIAKQPTKTTVTRNPFRK